MKGKSYTPSGSKVTKSCPKKHSLERQYPLALGAVVAHPPSKQTPMCSSKHYQAMGILEHATPRTSKMHTSN
jgi:hypothetical protein